MSTLRAGNLGFSLVELLVVLAIIAVMANLASISVSAAQTDATTRLESQLNGQMTQLRQFALTMNQPVRMKLSAKHSTPQHWSPSELSWKDLESISTVELRPLKVTSVLGSAEFYPSGKRLTAAWVIQDGASTRYWNPTFE